MLILTGTLRQFGEVKFDEGKKEMLKLWVEHETPRQDGPADLKIEELLIPKADVGPEASTLKQGNPVSVVVRTWAKGRDVMFQAVRLVNASATPQKLSEAK